MLLLNGAASGALPTKSAAGPVAMGATLEPLVSGPLKAAAGRAQAALFDDGPAGLVSVPAGKPLTITVYARGSLAAPLTLSVASSGAGVAITSAAGVQKLRVNSKEVAGSNATFAASACTQMLIGWGFLNHYPLPGFGGNVYAAIAGKGAPTAEELTVLERYLWSRSGD